MLKIDVHTHVLPKDIPEWKERFLREARAQARLPLRQRDQLFNRADGHRGVHDEHKGQLADDRTDALQSALGFFNPSAAAERGLVERAGRDAVRFHF